MHNVKAEDFQILQNKQQPDYINTFPQQQQQQHNSKFNVDGGIEPDCTEGNLSWLLNYKIHELPPVPGERHINSHKNC